jgi:type IV secretion system protein VirB9
MIRPFCLVAAAALAASPALASDARLASRLYDPEEVVRIDGQVGVQASIAFAEDERIENVAIGDSSSWQVTPNKRANLLFVKPLSPRARTNMTVVTDRRTYFFDLAAAPGNKPLYVLRFRYPDDPKPVRSGETSAVQQASLSSEEARVLAAAPANLQPDPAQLNFAWKTQGKANLLPARVYDDGNSTFLSWPVGAPLPAILVRDTRGNEGPVNFAVRGDVIVVEGVPPLILLRFGKDLATLEFQGKQRPVAPASDFGSIPVIQPAATAATP